MKNHSSNRFRILVADDDDAILNIYRKVLFRDDPMKSNTSEMDAIGNELFEDKPLEKTSDSADISYDLTICRQGDEAIEAARLAVDEDRPFSIVFMDIRMPPGKDGVWAAEQIRKIDPLIEIVFVSGYSDINPAKIAQRISPAHKLLYIQKPFHPFEITQFATTLSMKWQTENKLRQSHEKLEEKLQDRTKEIVEMNQKLMEDIDHRKKTEKKLRQSEAQLKKAYAELKDTQAQLIQSAKLASIGELAAGVAHELNQPLMIMRMAGQLTERSIKKNRLSTEDIFELQDTIQRNSQRMMKIINHLRMFSRQSSGNHELINVNNIIEGSFLMVNEQLRLRNITPQKDLMKNLPGILGDANQIEQVLLNLITNARDAIEEKILRSGNKMFDGQIKIVTRRSGVKKDHIEILIKDNGDGIPELKRDKIFDPFFTTKAVGKGTGLGLSISYGIIKEHKGEIVLLETGSQGTSFGITLPLPEN